MRAGWCQGIGHDQGSQYPPNPNRKNGAKPNSPVVAVRELRKKSRARTRQDKGELLVGLEPTTTRFQDLKIKM